MPYSTHLQLSEAARFFLVYSNVNTNSDTVQKWIFVLQVNKGISVKVYEGQLSWQVIAAAVTYTPIGVYIGQTF